MGCTNEGGVPPGAAGVRAGSGGPYAPAGVRTPFAREASPLAVVSLLCALACCPVGSLAGVLLGHLALHRIRRTGAGGRRFAVSGIVLGYAGLLAALAVVLIALVAGVDHDGAIP